MCDLRHCLQKLGHYAALPSWGLCSREDFLPWKRQAPRIRSQQPSLQPELRSGGSRRCSPPGPPARGTPAEERARGTESSGGSTKGTRALPPAGHGARFSFPAENISPARCGDKAPSGDKHLPQPRETRGDEHGTHPCLSATLSHADLTRLLKTTGMSPGSSVLLAWPRAARACCSSRARAVPRAAAAPGPRQ